MTNDEKNTAGLIQIKKREDVCPSKTLDLKLRPRTHRRRHRPRRRRKNRPRILALARRTRRLRRIQRGPAPRIPQRRLRMGRLRLAPRIPQSHGRLARPGGFDKCDRMRPPPARAHRPLRAPARRRHPRPPHVLRDGEHARRIRQPATGRKPSRSSHESRRQRSAPGLARRHRHFCASLAPRPLRSRPLADRHVDGRRPLVGSRFSARSAARSARRKPCRARASAF